MGLLGLMLIPILWNKKIMISDASADIIISVECGYQILVRKICKRGRISYNLNLFPNIIALNRKHFTY